MFSGRSFTSIRILALLAAAFSMNCGAHAFSLDGKRWTYNRTVVMHLSLERAGVLQDGFPSFNASAADALETWNTYLDHMKFAAVIGSSLVPSDGDADNSVFFSDTVYGQSFGTNVLAVTLISSRLSVFTETDVIFNNRISWDSYSGSLQIKQDFHRVAIHEFGHALGLNHPDDAHQVVIAIMNSRISDIESPQADDIAGARSIYNSGPNYLSANPAPNLVNLSTRGFVGTGDSVLIGGLIIQGSQAATVVLRAIGHSLAARAISKPLTDPVIELRNAAGTLVAQNDDWIEDANAETIASYRLDPSNSRESALLQTLSPGNYTALVRAYDNGDGNLTGTALVELYDLHTSNGRAGNIATRGLVSASDGGMIAGFIVGGTQAKEVVIRGIGPSLADSGIANALPNPIIELHNASGALVDTNDNWQSDANAPRVMQLALAPRQPVESALDRTLNPGTYTVILRGVNDVGGVGLVEVYDVTPAP